MLEYITAHPDVIAAAFSALATLFAAVATWRGPRSAAKLAEALRRQGDERHEARQTKLRIFATVMQERSAIWSEEALRALNLVDVAFSQSREVREAWSSLFLAFDPNRRVPEHAMQERLQSLLRGMATDLGLSHALTVSDFERVYQPAELANERWRQTLERDEAIRRLQAQTAPGVNAAASMRTQDQWPPKPRQE